MQTPPVTRKKGEDQAHCAAWHRAAPRPTAPGDGLAVYGVGVGPPAAGPGAGDYVWEGKVNKVCTKYGQNMRKCAHICKQGDVHDADGVFNDEWCTCFFLQGTHWVTAPHRAPFYTHGNQVYALRNHLTVCLVCAQDPDADSDKNDMIATNEAP